MDLAGESGLAADFPLQLEYSPVRSPYSYIETNNIPVADTEPFILF